MTNVKRPKPILLHFSPFHFQLLFTIDNKNYTKYLSFKLTSDYWSEADQNDQSNTTIQTTQIPVLEESVRIFKLVQIILAKKWIKVKANLHHIGQPLCLFQHFFQLFSDHTGAATSVIDSTLKTKSDHRKLPFLASDKL